MYTPKPTTILGSIYTSHFIVKMCWLHVYAGRCINRQLKWVFSACDDKKTHLTYVVLGGGFSPAKCLEVNKCAFTFSSEIRQIQCTRTEFWCVQCPRPAGPSALDKHQIQASALDLSYCTSKSKCKFINLIHTPQKNKIICSCSWKIINKMALKCY